MRSERDTYNDKIASWILLKDASGSELSLDTKIVPGGQPESVDFVAGFRTWQGRNEGENARVYGRTVATTA